MTRSIRATVLFILILVTFILLGAIAWNTQHEQELASIEAHKVVTNMTKAVSQQARDTFENADSLLVGMVEMVETAQFSIDKIRMHSYLRSNASSRASLRGLFIYDKDGRWIVNSLGYEQTQFNNADREYFQHHRAFAGRGPHIGSPITSRSTGDRIITLSRRINDANGAFAGVALATISVNYFKKFYETFDIGAQGAILLASDDGKLLTRRPYKERTPDNISTGPVFREYRARGPAGVAMLVSPSDDVERLYAYQHLGDYPVLVTVGLAEVEIFDRWREKTILAWTLTLSILTLLWLFGLRLIKQLNTHEANQLAVIQAKDEVERVNEQLSALALTDGLTGLANRRRFDAMLNVEFSRASRDNSLLTLAMVDVDFFKKYNDAYGHVKGDECLRIVAEVLSEALSRPTDLVARYGGEEFCLILPATDSDGGGLIAEQIMQAIEQRRIPHEGSYFGFVTVSIGIACSVPRSSDTAEQLLNAADSALYVAKEKGRNQIYTFSC